MVSIDGTIVATALPTLTRHQRGLRRGRFGIFSLVPLFAQLAYRLSPLAAGSLLSVRAVGMHAVRRQLDAVPERRVA